MDDMDDRDLTLDDSDLTVCFHCGGQTCSSCGCCQNPGCVNCSCPDVQKEAE